MVASSDYLDPSSNMTPRTDGVPVAGMKRHWLTGTLTWTSGSRRCDPVDNRNMAHMMVKWPSSLVGGTATLFGSHTSESTDMAAIHANDSTVAKTVSMSTGWNALPVDEVFSAGWISFSATAAATTTITGNFMGKT